MFKAGQAGAIWATSPAESRKRTENEQKFVATLMQWKNEDWARRQQCWRQTIVPYMLKRATVYSRLSQFSNAKVPVATMIVIDENGDTEAFHNQAAKLTSRRP